MSTKTTTSILIIAATLAVAALVGASILFYVIYQKSGTLADLSQSLAQATSEESAYSTMKHLLAETKQERAKLDEYFVGNDNAASFAFIDSIEDLSKITKVSASVNSVNLEPIQGADTFEHVAVNVTSEGSLSNVYWFLSLIEALPIQHELRTVSLDKLPSGDKKTGDVWRLIFTLRAAKLK